MFIKHKQITLKLYKYGLQTANTLLFQDKFLASFTLGWWKNKQLAAVALLFYSTSIFILWCLFLEEHALHFIFILKQNELINFSSLVNIVTYGSAEAWIPGTLTNSLLVHKSLRYKKLQEKKMTTLHKVPNGIFMFFSMIKKNIIEEVTQLLIPNIVILNSIIHSITKYFTILFIPVMPSKYKNIYQAKTIKFLYLNIVVNFFQSTL